jgi:hypothetical protein
LKTEPLTIEKKRSNLVITKPDWNQPEERAYFHQISPDCISRLAEVVTTLSKGKVDVETAFRKYEQILSDEISDPEFLAFAIGNLNELSDVDEIWFDVDEV